MLHQTAQKIRYHCMIPDAFYDSYLNLYLPQTYQVLLLSS